MASAIVTGVRGSGKVVDGGTDLIATIYFSGGDVSGDVEGHPYEYIVRLPSGYTLGDLKSGLANAVQTVAGQLGLTVGTQDTDLLSFEHGA